MFLRVLWLERCRSELKGGSKRTGDKSRPRRPGSGTRRETKPRYKTGDKGEAGARPRIWLQKLSDRKGDKMESGDTEATGKTGGLRTTDPSLERQEEGDRKGAWATDPALVPSGDRKGEEGDKERDKGSRKRDYLRHSQSTDVFLA